jgi:sulfur-oxidizing protein SoxY
MTPESFVKAIGVFSQKNPQPDVAIFRFSARSGRAAVSTRIRLHDSQTIVAVAAYSDGSFWSGSADLIVTLPACADP